MKIGITGTREGATDAQLIKLIEFFKTLPAGVELHHGDCVGVDVEVATIAKEFNCKVVCHPPLDSSLRGFFESDEYFPPLGYLARDRKIVETTNLLLVVPLQMERQSHGGTWYTCSYAKKKNLQHIIFWPDGTTEKVMFDIESVTKL